MIERILHASDGPGAWTVAVAVAHLVTATQVVVTRVDCSEIVVREPGSRV